MKGRDRTRSGLTLLMIGVGLAWIPYLNELGGLFSFIGIIMIFLGRHAYGERHHRFALGGSLLIFLGIVIEVGVVLSFASSVLSVASSSATPSQVGSALQGDVQGLFYTIAFAGIMSAFGQLLLVYGLADRLSRTLLIVGFVIATSMSLLILAIVLPQVTSAIDQATSGATFDLTPLSNLETTDSLLAVLGAPADVLFIWAYYRIREHPEMEVPLRRTSGPAVTG